MITPLKFFVASASVGAVAGLVVEHRLIARQETQLVALRQQSAQLAQRSAELLASAPREQEASGKTTTPPPEQPASTLHAENRAREGGPEVKAWLERVRLFPALLEATPSEKIPEFQLMTDADWLDLAQRVELYHAPNPAAIERLFCQLRDAAKGKFAGRVGAAVEGFAKANRGLLPNAASELAPYFKPAIDPAILQRYEMLLTGPRANLAPETPLLVEKSLINERYDHPLQVNAGRGWTWLASVEEMNNYIETASESFARANAGQTPTDPAQLMPYLSPTNVALPTLQKFWSSPLRRNISLKTPPTQ